VEFQILGPLEVRSNDGPLPLGGPNQRALLALLLLHANESVGRERLIDEIWDDSPPKTAHVSLNGYVSRLRKLIANGSGAVIETRADGYLLRVDPDRLDANRFERLLAEAREARSAGRPQEAKERLAAALGLWRGRPLADLEYASFAQSEIARLQELRLSATEDRLEAELELGNHKAIIGELEKLAAEHPLRERISELLMLALYLSNRQGEALDVYTQTRRRIAEEIGLEPSASLQDLHRRMLQHDPGLGPAADARVRTPATSRRPGTGRRTAALVLGLLACATAVGLVLGFATTPGAHGTTVAPNSLAVLDPSADSFVGDIPLGKAPTAVAYGSRAAWAVNEHGRVVSRIDPHRLRVVHNIPMPMVVRGLAAGGGRLWLAGRNGRIFRLDPSYDKVDERSGRACGGCGASLAFGAKAVWTTDGLTNLFRVDPGSLQATRAPMPFDRGAYGVAVGAGAVWVAGDVVSRIDPKTLLPAALPITVGGVEAIAVGADAVWAAVGQKVVKINPDGSVDGSAPVGSNPSSIVVGAGAVWVANSSDGTITKIDPGQAKVIGTIHVGRSPVSLAFGGNRLWVAVQ
jgi:YVTN family beta-propeller protein